MDAFRSAVHLSWRAAWSRRGGRSWYWGVGSAMASEPMRRVAMDVSFMAGLIGTLR